LLGVLARITENGFVSRQNLDANMLPQGPVRLKFWGVRGSTPAPGPGTVHYGGNTACVEVRAEGQLIILDAGTGLRLLGRELMDEFKEQPLNLTLLLTHTHWDHIQGLPFFRPIYGPQNRVRILGFEGARNSLCNVLSSQMESPYFPVTLNELPASVDIEELKEMQFDVGPIRVEASFAHHPGICVGYRLFTNEGSIAYFPDNEPHCGARHAPTPAGHSREEALRFAQNQDQKMADFLRGTDVLIMDAQYDCEEYKQHIGWGHACVDDVVALAALAEVKRLYLFHHDPDHDDAKISAMVAHARDLAMAAKSPLQIEAAREGEVVRLTPVS
jgi:phosphoribosyl 1,2-cyclic phosphodiesterase